MFILLLYFFFFLHIFTAVIELAHTQNVCTTLNIAQRSTDKHVLLTFTFQKLNFPGKYIFLNALQTSKHLFK